MSLSLNNPLIIGDINKKTKEDISQIKQDIGDLSQLDTADKSSLVNALNEAIDSTLNGASRDLDNLSDVGNDKLRSLNSYANNGELLTDPDGLSFVEKYAHSIFDRSKFTVVGSPNITDDGIMTTTTNNYVKVQPIYKTHKSFNIHGAIRIDDNWTSDATKLGFILGGGTDSTYTVRLQLSYNSGVRIMFHKDVDGTATLINKLIDTPVRWQTGSVITYDIGFNADTMTYYCKLYIDEVLAVNYSSVDTYYPYIGTNTDTLIVIGVMQAGYPVTGGYFTTDLKQFSITVDGVEVFSGNKTGIDTIKPDDYTVVGTPTISTDGVASGFSSSNKINPLSINLTDNFVITYKVKFGTTSATCLALGIYNSSNTLFLDIRQDSSSSKIMYRRTDSNYPTYATETSVLGATKSYKIVKNGNNLSVYSDGVLIGSTVTDMATTSGTYTLYIGQSNSSLYWLGSIDLNAFKIYIDGNLVYQPCLKIPYTESKTGSKIVDSIYRDRVNDMAEQFGYANYYTLDEDNGNFTLPQVELYGLIGQRTLRDSYRNGINYWELYSNRDLEQGGSCTSGVEVTFPKPFADTNYVLSVPYSAKSATAFTPTQTGDWIAKGKGLL